MLIRIETFAGPTPSLPKYDDLIAKSAFRILIVVFGEGARRAGGAVAQSSRKSRVSNEFAAQPVLPKEGSGVMEVSLKCEGSYDAKRNLSLGRLLSMLTRGFQHTELLLVTICLPAKNLPAKTLTAS